MKPRIVSEKEFQIQEMPLPCEKEWEFVETYPRKQKESGILERILSIFRK